MAKKFPLLISAAPRVGAIYWCSLHPEEHVHIPEFWKKRPVAVISRRNSMYGKVIVLPITTNVSNRSNAGAHQVSVEVANRITGVPCWIVCDNPMTVATSRLENISRTPTRFRGAELDAILRLTHGSIAGNLLHGQHQS